MGTTPRWTSADLDVLPDDGKRYEIIDGEIYVSRQPGYHHQYACSQLNIALGVWSNQTNVGVTLQAPGVIFADDDDVAGFARWMQESAPLERLQSRRKEDASRVHVDRLQIRRRVEHRVEASGGVLA